MLIVITNKIYHHLLIQSRTCRRLRLRRSLSLAGGARSHSGSRASGHACFPLATLRATAKAAKLPSLFHTAADSSRVRVFPERKLALTFLTGRLEALDDVQLSRTVVWEIGRAHV